jgi:hypothetical protein
MRSAASHSLGINVKLLKVITTMLCLRVRYFSLGILYMDDWIVDGDK